MWGLRNRQHLGPLRSFDVAEGVEGDDGGDAAAAQLFDVRQYPVMVAAYNIFERPADAFAHEVLRVVDEVLAETKRVVRELAGLADLADEGDDAGAALPAVGRSVPAFEQREGLGAMLEKQRLEHRDADVVHVRPAGEGVCHAVEALEVLR